MKKLVIITGVIMQAFIFFSCSKQGPAGPQGTTGLQGPVGSPGSQGQTGSANVIYSSWFLTGSGWDTTGASNYKAIAIFDKAAPAITQSILDSGLVLCYMKGDPTTGLSNQVFPLPYSVGIGTGLGFVDLWDFVLDAPGNIRFLYKSDNPWTLAELATISFRYIVIPGGVAGGRMLDPRKMTYEQVCTLYNIPQ